ncbi:hypothetical protein [Phyllobacterium ifriqiyense]|uniref:hypothetical protein n=1 Tax=Phyllobacterium ifriqiyense TaxID=314238 RepID=UPI00339B427B
MYPVSIGFDQALERIEALLENGHHAEALVTSIFTFEKLVKRSLRRAVMARGFSRQQADTIMGKEGFEKLKNIWPVFERKHRPLPSILGNVWEPIPKAKSMRNDLVHGNKVYDLDECQNKAKEVLAALRALHAFIKQDYGSDPWKEQPRPKTNLQWVV